MGKRRLAGLTAALALVLSTAPPAVAEPPPDPVVDTQTAEPDSQIPGATQIPGAPQIPGATTLALTELGASGTISFGRFNRDNATGSVTFPVPPGLVPVGLRGRLELPISLRFGNVSAGQADRTLSRVGLPPQDGAELTVPLPGVQVNGGFASINLRMVALAQDPYCWDNEAPIRLVDAAVVFSGAETPPRNVAEFLPPVLRRAVIALPAQPSLAESTAAVRVATAVAGRNGQKIDVRVVRLPEGKTVVDLPPGPLEREIVVKEGPAKGLSLQSGPGMPALLISGMGDDLAAQAGLLTSDAMRFAASAKSSSGPLLEDQLLGADTTLKEMGNASLNGQTSTVVDINQTRFGRPLRDIRVHLIGSYTPLPDSFGGEVTVSVAGHVLDRWSATPDGVIDKWVTIPNDLVGRLVSVQVGLRSAGEQGDCNRLAVPLRIDGSTEIQTESANPPVPQGFQSLPQALMPLVQIGIGSDAFADTVRAAQIMVGLQRVSSVPLNTTVTSLTDALASRGSAVLVAADGWTDPSVSLPFSVNGSEVTVVGVKPTGQPVTLNLDPASKFGSLQTVFDGSRALMIATSNGAPDQLDKLLNWLGAERGRWAELNGQAVISVPDADPVTVANPPSAVSMRTDESGVLDQPNNSWWLLAGAAALAAAVVFVLVRRRAR